MRVLLSLAVIVGVVWPGLLFTGYEIAIARSKKPAGPGLRCRYLTARCFTRQFIPSQSG